MAPPPFGGTEMAFYRKGSWWCYGCKKWHPLSRYIEAESATEGTWCATSVKQAIKAQRNIDFPAHLIESFRREMGLR